MIVPCDVTKENEVKNAIESTVARFGTIHVALACAGIPWPTPTLTSQGPFNSEIFEKVLAVNVMGSVYMAKYAGVAMSKTNPSTIKVREVFLSSSVVSQALRVNAVKSPMEQAKVQ